MAALRVPSSLWNIFARSSDVHGHPNFRAARAAAFTRAYHPSRRRGQQEQINQRYGTANEPPPHLGGGKGLGPPTKKAGKNGEPSAQVKLPKIGERLQRDGEKEVKADAQAHEQPKEAKVEEPADIEAQAEKPRQKKHKPRSQSATIKAPTEAKPPSPISDPMLDSTDALPSSEPPGSPAQPAEKPMASILNTVPHPADQSQNKKDTTAEDAHAEEHPDRTFDEHSPPIKAPHIEQPRYIHHYDTYGFVKRLEDGGWAAERAITIMKAVRLMLADNTDLAKDALVSKSQLENEAYLFKAACAELKTEVTTRRKSEQEKMRTERTQLQHEVDILSQRLGQESAGLKDDLKGMFDDRKMAVRNEQRDMESKLQQLNYKITVSLQADAKSEVEELRWVMTRRVIFTLVTVVLMVVASLKIASDAIAGGEESGAKKAKTKGPSTSSGSAGSSGERMDGVLSIGDGNLPRRIAPGEIVVKEGDNPAFISLG